MSERLLQLIYHNNNNNGFRNVAKTEMSSRSQQDASNTDAHGKIFNADCALKILETVLNENIEDYAVYNDHRCVRLCEEISIEIRDRIKQLGFDRYKIITTVQIAEKKCQGLLSVARMLCDKEWDRYAVLSKETPSFVVVACVFGIHLD